MIIRSVSSDVKVQSGSTLSITSGASMTLSSSSTASFSSSGKLTASATNVETSSSSSSHFLSHGLMSIKSFNNNVELASGGGKAVLFSDGNFGINVGKALAKLHVGGNAVVDGTVTANDYYSPSDRRLKENVTAITSATDRLKQLNPVRFNFIVDPDTTVDGFIAHEVQSVVPEAITGTHNEVDADGNPVYQGIDQSKLVPLLVATIKELEARITALENA